jgi:hypothetical protein
MPAVGAVAGAAVPGTVGASAKALANALTKRGVSKVDELIRMESPMYQAMPRQAVNPATQQAIIRALLGLEMQPQQ